MAKQFRNGIKRFEFVGKGAFTRPKLILANPQRKKQSPLTGKVVKQLYGKVTKEELSRIKNLIATYQEMLQTAGVAVIETHVRGGLKSKGKFGVALIQEYVPEKQVLKNVISNCSTKEAVNLFREVMDIIERVNEYNKHGPGQIGLDVTIKNFALVENKITLIDTYPPFVRNVTTRIEPEDYTGRKRHWYQRVFGNIFKSRRSRIGKMRIEKKFNHDKQIQIAKEQFLLARQDLKGLI